MLAGSTPTSTARPWKKISSRQPTSTRALHWASNRVAMDRGSSQGRREPSLPSFAEGRRRYLLNHAEVKKPGPEPASR